MDEGAFADAIVEKDGVVADSRRSLTTGHDEAARWGWFGEYGTTMYVPEELPGVSERPSSLTWPER